MKVTRETIYRIVDGSQTYMIRFSRESSVPGFSYRVAIIEWPASGRLALVHKDWLAAGTRPSKKVARFFYEKHC